MLALATPEPVDWKKDASPLKRYKTRFAALEKERGTWDAHWQDLADDFLPRSGQLKNEQPNLGDRRNTGIINSTPLRSVRIASAGMMAGITSPARPWFRLTTPDPELAEAGAVRGWLDVVESRIRETIAKSNLYNILPQLYTALLVFGTAVAIVDEDEEDDVRAYVIPTGRYVLATSARGRVDTLLRRYQPTVVQVVEAFGLERCSHSLREQYNRGNTEQRVKVAHAIEPNRNRTPGRMDARNKPWRSCWYEESRPETDKEPFLRESGYEEFPVLATRWDVMGDDVYGRSPGMDGLGDARALQKLEERKLNFADKTSNPPVGLIGDLIDGNVDLRPGGVNALPLGGDIKALIAIRPEAMGVLREIIQDHETRIDSTMFVDLFMMMANSDRRQITATEVAERHEEKMLQLGPVLERMDDEMLEPMIDRIFGILWRKGRIPPPPPELAQTASIKVDFISILAQAQKLVATASVERLAGFVGNLAAAKPEVLDKLDADEMVDEYANALGVKSNLIVPDDQVAALREQRAQQAQMAQQAAVAQQAVEGAKVMSETDLSRDSALSRVLGGTGGLPQ